MIELEAIPWDSEAWEAESWRGRGGGRPVGGRGSRTGSRRARSGRPRYGGAQSAARQPRWSGLARGAAAGPAGAPRWRFVGGRWRPYRRPWIFGPWSAAPPWLVEPWTAPPPDPAAVAEPDAAAPLPPDPGAEPAPPAGPDAGAPDGEPASELELKARVVSPPVTIQWQGPHRFDRPGRILPAGVSGAGLYLVLRGKVPVYVGETGDFSDRWIGPSNGYLTKLAKMWLPTRCCALDVYFGTLPANKPVREHVEASVIRTLIRTGLGRGLRQLRSTRPFRGLAPGVHIRNVLPPQVRDLIRAGAQTAPYDRANNSLVVQHDAVYELE